MSVTLVEIERPAPCKLRVPVAEAVYELRIIMDLTLVKRDYRGVGCYGPIG